MENKNPLVTIEMENGGVIKVELYPEYAPNTVNNFISLVNKHFYDGIIFHRVIKGFMIQGEIPSDRARAAPATVSKASSPITVSDRTRSSTKEESFHGKINDERLRRLPVLYHAPGRSPS